MLCKPPRGTQDIFSNNHLKFKFIYDYLYTISKKEGFEAIETPIFELENIFTKNLGTATDIIKNEIYKITEKGNEKLALRPEFTASVVRAYISNNLYLKNAGNFFSFGPLFRYDRPQAGRYRQFWQANFEKIGFADCISEIQLIYLGWKILSRFVTKFTLHINHLGNPTIIKEYKNIITKYFKIHQNKLSQISQERIEDHPLRILDSKNINDIEVVKNAPKISTLYTKEIQDQFSKVLKELENKNINYILDHTLVRGLDYYTGIIFEFKNTSIESGQSAILAGGRYDNLVSQISQNKINSPAIGMALGIERLILASSSEKFNIKDNKYLGIVSYTNNSKRILEIMQYTESLKENILPAPMHLSINKQFEYLDKHNVKNSILIYDDTYYIKNLINGNKIIINKLSNISEIIKNIK